jgi:drug/metabolite transporter (DMT)-like permease
MRSGAKILPAAAFCALGIIWGSNFIYMKLAAEWITPLQIVFFRVLFGFLPVLALAFARRALRREHLRHWPHFLAMSVLATAFYYYGFAKGTSLLLSGVAGAVSGAIPLFSFVLAAAFLPEGKATKMKIAGVISGFIGVLILGRPSGEEIAASNLEGVAYMAAGALSVGASFVYAQKFVVKLKIPAVALTAYQLGFALLLLALIADVGGGGDIFIHPDALHASLGLVIGLGLLGTGAAYILYYYIIEKLGAVAASSATYIPPVIALLIGALLVGEPIGLLDCAATALIFAGVFLLRQRAAKTK